MLTLNDGRAELWQWDTGRTLAVDADCSQVHFSNTVFGRSKDVDVIDGVAVIPDILLQVDKDLNVWAFVGTAENGYTKISKTFKVNRRNKPADYVFTPTEQMTLQMIQRQIGDLADLTTEAKENLVAAINEAAASGGGSSDFIINASLGSDGQWTLDKTFAQIREAVTAGNNPVVHFEHPLIEGTLVMPLTNDFGSGLVFRVTFSADDGYQSDIAQYSISAFQDGRVIFGTAIGLSLDSNDELRQVSMAAEPTEDMQIATKKYVDDHAGGGTDMGITGATVGQIAKITAVDASGVPTAWAPVDMPSGGGGSTSASEEIVVETHTISELPAGRTAIVSGLAKYKKFMMQWVFKDTSASTDNNCYMCFNERGGDYVPYKLGHGTAWKQYACVVVENYENSALIISGADGSSERGTMYYPQAFSAPIDKFGPRWLDSAITTIDGTITIYGILKDTSVLEGV